MTFTTTNFQALEVRQGYRKDNTYFGVCSECQEHITKSRFSNEWTHTLYLVKETNHSVSKQINYCPSV